MGWPLHIGVRFPCVLVARNAFRAGMSVAPSRDMRITFVPILLGSLLLPVTAFATAGVEKTPGEMKKEALGKANETLGEFAGTVKDLKNGKVTQKFGTKESPLFGEVSVDTGMKAAPCDRTSLSVSVEAFAGVRTPSLGKILKLKASAKLGGRASLELLIPDDSLDAIRKHDEKFPNPWDPTSIPVGSTVVLRRGVFEALGLEAAYRGLTAKSKESWEQGDVVAVARLANGDLRLAVGPYDKVAREVEYGVGVGPLALSLTGKASVETGTVRIYDFAANDPAYEAALTAGTTLQNENATPAETITYATGSTSTGVKGTVGPFSRTLHGQTTKGELRQITRSDGSSSVDAFHRTGDGTTAIVHTELDANGKIVSEKVALRFHDANQDTRDLLSAVFSADGTTQHDPGANPAIEITDWKKWRELARHRVLEIDPQWKPGRGNSLYPLAGFLADATSPADLAERIARVGRGNGLSELWRLRHALNSNALLPPLPTRLLKEKPVKACQDPTGSQIVKQDSGEFLRP